MKAKLLNASLVIAMLLILVVPVAQAAPSTQGADRGPIFKSSSDDAPHPLGDKQRAARQVAFQAQVRGLASGSVYDLGHGQYVELERVGEDSIWTILAEFGDTIDPFTGGTPGPVHNQIPKPDRTVDNATIWTRNFSQAYFDKLLFSEAPKAVSMRNFYIEQSSNRYTVNGTVEDWVQVEFNEAYYGSNLCGSISAPLYGIW
jgi:immune inhibitor A